MSQIAEWKCVQSAIAATQTQRMVPTAEACRRVLAGAGLHLIVPVEHTLLPLAKSGLQSLFGRRPGIMERDAGAEALLAEPVPR